VAGDTVNVCPGLYAENLVIMHSVRITGIGGRDLTSLLPPAGAPGVEVLDDAAVALTGFEIAGGSGVDYGAGVQNFGAGGIDLVDMRLVGHTVTLDGAALWTAGPLSAHETEFFSNVAERSGGAIAALGDITLTGGLLSDNQALSGGAIAIFDSDLTCANTTISGNSAEHGGGLLLSDGAVTDCVLRSNTAFDSGGGVVLTGANVLTGVEIVECDAINVGGGLVVGPGGSAQLVATGVRFNNAADGGGVALGAASTLEMDAVSEITANAAIAAGGGVFGEAATVVGGNVTGNFAESGGGLFLVGGAVTGTVIALNEATALGGGAAFAGAGSLLDASVDSNLAAVGGGVWISVASVELTGTSVAGNDTVQLGGGLGAGGGVAVTSNGQLIGGSILFNTATLGGGLALLEDGFGSPAGARSVEVSFNEALLAGGGVYVNTACTLDDATLSGNSAVAGGGARISGAPCTFDNVVADANAANLNGGGLSVGDSGELVLTNGSLTANAAPAGGGLQVGAGSSVNVRFTAIDANVGSIVGGGVLSEGEVTGLQVDFGVGALNPTEDLRQTTGSGPVTRDYDDDQAFACTLLGCVP
jgi:predicted outer membrane repeat protein